MVSPLPKYALVALSLTATVTMTAPGGSALAQSTGIRIKPNVNPPAPVAAGSLLDGSESEATDQAATEEEAVEPASDEAPAASAPSADEPPADTDDETANESEPDQAS